ncbi:tRNA (adenine(22)-N(1))-methyltransferase [Acetivibrio straminisolvens]|jgi:tRNA (adenine22-N1)-methyltransferase|uniref:tRNA (adenine(22)-N(1))-methyltransferase n=1 Tax=Acetivibrio straminisolvens TaxID=253314 RepID=UPI00223F22C0|nr:class I SAM-dependent methyltransferase [Acetivibrio straminisolvens]
MELKGRLKLIADMTPNCNIVCDIGTDHAYIPIYLVMNKKCQRALACDVRKGPISFADKNIDEYGLSQYISTRIGYGLDPIEENEVDVIIIAGMGGQIIKEILERSLAKAQKAKALIIQPMNAIELIRQWLYEKGFDIFDEKLAKEEDRIYNAMIVKWTGKAQSKEEAYYYIGEKLFENKDPLLPELIEKKIGQMEKIILEMEKMNDKNSKKRMDTVRIRDEISKLFMEYKEKA